MPRRRPVLGFFPLEIDQPGADEAIDPRTRICVQVDDEVICGPSRRSKEHNDCHDPMEKELFF